MKRTLLTIGFLLCAVGPAAEAQVVDVHGTYTQNVANQIPWAFGQTTYDMRTLVDNGPLLAMAATRRSNTPNVIDNGNGTWNALAGRDPNNVNPNFAMWDVSFYVGARNLPNFTYEFYYDFNPLANTTVQEFGGMNVPRACNPTCFATLDHINLGFGNLSSVGGNTFIVPPTAFDVNATGEYTFALAAYTLEGDLADYVAIKVNTVSAVPEPGTYALTGVGLLAMGLVARSRRRKIS